MIVCLCDGLLAAANRDRRAPNEDPMANLRLFAVFAVLCAAAGCSGVEDPADTAAAETGGIVITGVSVIDVRTGGVVDNQSVAIRDGVVRYVGATTPGAFSGAQVYDRQGRYVIPGLWDMHVHLRGGAELAEENAVWLRQYLGFGVTAVRDGGGDLSDEVLTWRAEIAVGERLGPRIFTSLQKLDGPASDWGWPGSIALAGVDDVGPALDDLERRGADFIKLYDGSMAGDVYLAAIEEAERRGLKTSGHMPLSVSFEDAIDAGLDGVEHEIYLAKAASPIDGAVSREVADALRNGDELSLMQTLIRLSDSGDPEQAQRTFDKMIASGAALIPTLHIGNLLENLTDASAHEDDAQLSEVPAGIRATFQERVSSRVERTPDEVGRDLALYAANRAVLETAADRGVTILAGSDTGAVNSYLYPGDSLHLELEELVSAGLTPLQALQGATLHAAKWLNQDERYGTVEAGKAADLVILERNPLENIRDTRSLVAVVQSGRYFDRGELAELRALP